MGNLELSAEGLTLLLFHIPGSPLCRPSGDEVGDDTNQEITDRKGCCIKAKLSDTIGNSQIDKDLRGIDVRENTTVGVAMIGCGCVVTFL